MDSRVLLSLVVVCFITDPLYAEPIAASKPKLDSEQQAIKVLREWSEACRTFTSVRGDVQRIWYYGIFRTQKHLEGEFGYLGPSRCFWRFELLKSTSSAKHKKDRNKNLYALKESEAGELRWQKTRWILVNEDQKSYEEWGCANKPKRSYFLDVFFDLEADQVSPFLPGVPNQSEFNYLLRHSYFNVLKESETHIWIAGKLQRDSRYANNFREFKLYLEKRPWRLRAVQYTHPVGKNRAVYLFSNIEFNPLEWDEPNLAGYQKLTQKTEGCIIVASKPVKPDNGTSFGDVLSAIYVGLYWLTIGF